MSDITYECPHCNARARADAQACGTTLPCPSCGKPVILPALPPAGAKMARVVAAEDPAPEDEREHDTIEVHPAARAFMGRLTLGILLLPLLVFWASWALPRGDLWTLGTLPLCAIGPLILVSVWYSTHALRYRLTSQRLFVYRGLIARGVDEIELFRIKDVTVQQTLMQRLLGVGTVSVLSSDDSTPQLVLPGVEDPLGFKETLRTEYRAARKREHMGAAEWIPS